MGDSLFNRDFKLTIGEDPTLSGTVDVARARVITTRPDPTPGAVSPPSRGTLRVAFKVDKNIYKQTLNTAEVTIYNLSVEHRALLQKKNAPCSLEAGYIGNSAQIFSGQVNIAGHVKEGPDWITKFHTIDGIQAVQSSRVNESLGPGTTVAQASDKLIKALGIGVGNSLEQLGLSLPRPIATFQKGIVFSGRTYDVLGGLMSACGLDMSIQDGAVQLLPPAGVNGDQAVVLDAAHGLIGNVEEGEDKQKKPTILAKSLLQPAFRPGTTVYLKSRNSTGYFRVENVTHTGDNWGQAWYSDLVLMAIDPPTGGQLAQLQKLEALP